MWSVALLALAMAAQPAHASCTPTELGAIATPGLALEIERSGCCSLTVPLGTDGVWFRDISEADGSTHEYTVDTPGTAVASTRTSEAILIADGESGLTTIKLHIVYANLSTADFAADVASANDYAVVAAKTAGFVVVDLTGAVPTAVASRATSGWARGVEIVGNRLYVAVWQSGLEIWDVSTPANPSLLGKVDTPDRAVGVFVDGAMAWVADRHTGLVGIDVSNPAAPTIVSMTAVPDQATSVRVIDDIALVTDLTAGLLVFDVTTPAAPRRLGSIDTPGNAYATAGDAGYLYVADWAGGVRIFDTAACWLDPPIADFGFTPEVQLYGESVAFNDLSTGTIDSRFWDFGNGTTSLAANPVVAFAPGAYQVSLTVSNAAGTSTKTATIQSLCKDGGAAPCNRPRTLSIVGAAHADGAEGSLWRSDLVLHSTTSGTATVTFSPFGGGADSRIDVSIPAGGTVELADIVGRIAGDEAAAGTLSIRETGYETTSTRLGTFDVSGPGRYGQGMSAFDVADESLERQHRLLAGAAWNDDVRTNLGAINLGSTSLELDVRFGDLAPIAWTIPADSSLQTSLKSLFPSLADRSGAITIDRRAGGRFSAWASRIENRSGDPDFVPDDALVTEDFWLPGVASIGGANGTLWRTRLAYAAETDGMLYLTFHSAAGAVSSINRTTLAGASLEVPDLLADWFGAGGDWGFVHGIWRGSAPMALWASTYNDASTGAFGQTIAPIAEDQLLGAGDEARLIGLAHNEANRTNLGLIATGGDAVVSLNLLGADGVALTSPVSISLAAQQVWQKEIFDFLGVAEASVATAVVRVLSGGPVATYASRIDRETGDPVFIAPSDH